MGSLKTSIPEDTVISKLLWLRQGATERSTEDIRGILRAHPGRLDLDCLDSMVRQLRLENIWRPLQPNT